MSDRIHPLEPWERWALRDYIQNTVGSLGPGSEVEDIIRLAIASASRFLPATARKQDVGNTGKTLCATPAFEQRIVALFGD